MLEDYFEDSYLAQWRTFIRRIRKSHPFAELWNQCCEQFYGKGIILQIDTPTRWSSTVAMLAKAVTVKEAVERMMNCTRMQDNKEHLVCRKIV